MPSTFFGWVIAVGLSVVLLGALWLVSALPRARKWTARCAEDMNTPFPNWCPPSGEPPRNLPVPSFDGVEWSKLSPQVDETGVHTVDYDAGSQRGISGKRRVPSNIAHFAIKHAKMFLESGDPDDLLLCARQIEHITESAAEKTIDGRPTVLWSADFNLGYQYNVTAPWSSAYFQIYSMNALLWGHWLFGDTRYLEMAEQGLIPLSKSIAEGGLGSPTKNGGLFFEEVVSEPAHHILNGHLHTLINIHYFGEYTGLSEAGRLFDRGVTALVDMLPDYDRRGYSLYSHAPNPGIRNHFNIANPFYHRTHIRLLRKLHELTGREEFARRAARWLESCNGPFDTLWAVLLIMFRDYSRFAKSI